MKGKAEPARIFSIYLPASLYNKLEQRAGKMKVNTLIREILVKELGNDNEGQEQLLNEYRECYANPRMLKEARQ
jgi:hypothetical protein